LDPHVLRSGERAGAGPRAVGEGQGPWPQPARRPDVRPVETIHPCARSIPSSSPRHPWPS